MHTNSIFHPKPSSFSYLPVPVTYSHLYACCHPLLTSTQLISLRTSTHAYNTYMYDHIYVHSYTQEHVHIYTLFSPPVSSRVHAPPASQTLQLHPSVPQCAAKGKVRVNTTCTFLGCVMHGTTLQYVDLHVAVPSRKRTLFRCVFRSRLCI